MRTRIRAAVLTLALIGQAAVIALPAAADEHPRVETIATGLDNPRGIDVAADGTIYVAEAGPGGDDFCIEVGEGDEAAEVCFGETSRIARIATDGTVTTEVGDLPSFMAGEGEFIGASDVTIGDGGTLFVSMGLGGDVELRDGVAAEWAPGGLLGTIQRWQGGVLTELADLAQWENDNDPNAGAPSTQGPMGESSNDSNPNGVLFAGGSLYAADAGGNTVLEVDPDTGVVTLRALLADRTAAAPGFLGLPPDTEIPVQAVPTNLAEGADDAILVSELTGFPFPVGGATVRELTDTTTPGTTATGFTNAMGLAMVDDDLYVLEFADNGLLSGDLTGALVRVRADGSRSVLLRDVLVAPGGIAAGPDGRLYITNMSVGEPGSGSVIAFDPSMAADEATQAACPPLSVAGNDLTDVVGTTHAESIDCVVWHGLFDGFGDDTFRAGADITRGQFATAVANLVGATDADLPAGATGQFTDVDGTTHAASINALASASVVVGFSDDTFRPGTSISRAQAVSILVAAYAHVTEADLAAGPDTFTDDDGSVHEANINASAAMGWVQGTSAETFMPSGDITRGQVASTLARIASDLVDAGNLQLPS